ncbi:hypothetical protein DICVIV_04931 [Dictyocaulus viviparus]|uniref:Uncharacterized protein n=1 Tax=Dictyocaulus viviparus TaxID=29172 RepID=A0A0D8Y309_DICVI|nr:hypothetical protein DICVIV_04931 [Dictyocaulus viviparus]
MESLYDRTCSICVQTVSSQFTKYSSIELSYLGDPDDRTLRRIEADFVIPNRMNAIIEKVECHEPYMGTVLTCFFFVLFNLSQ